MIMFRMRQSGTTESVAVFEDENSQADAHRSCLNVMQLMSGWTVEEIKVTSY